jgi:hypothetical protein
MAGPLLRLSVYTDEVLLHLDQIPKKLRQGLIDKFERIFDQITADLFAAGPAKYLDPSMAVTSIDPVGSGVSGSVEIFQKEGFYTITAKGRALRFLAGGELLYRRSVEHPYPKLKGETLSRELIRLKPWIEDQLYDTLIEAL